MSRRTTPALRVLIAAIPFAALAAPADAHATSIPVAPPASFGELVAMMPADAVSADGAMITYTDMTLLWERIGATDEAARLDSFGELAVRETFGITPQLFDNRFAQVDESEAEVGFNFTQIDRELAVIAPPRRIVIDVTSVSPGTIDAAIESNPGVGRARHSGRHRSRQLRRLGRRHRDRPHRDLAVPAARPGGPTRGARRPRDHGPHRPRTRCRGRARHRGRSARLGDDHRLPRRDR